MSKELFLERSLPSSVEAERSVLGAILLDNRLCNQAMEVLRPGDFYLDAHRKLYEKMIVLSEQSRPIDPLVLGEELRKTGEFEQVGGGAYIAGLIDSIPRLENIEQYTKIVKGKATLRRLITASNQIIATCFEQEMEPEQIIDAAEKAIFSIAEDRMRDGFVDVGSIAHDRLEEIEAMSGRAEMITGVPTGFTDLDKMTAGLQRSDLVIVAARPSMGKCLAFDAEIVLEDGRVATIEEIYRQRSARLLTLRDDWKLGLTEPSAYVDDGVKPVFRVTTRLGRTIETTITHPFLTIDGWRRLESLRAGDRIAVPRAIPIFGSRALRDGEVKLLAYFVGDSSLRGSTPSFTNNDERVLADFASAVAEFDGVKVHEISREDRARTVIVSADARRIVASRDEFARRLASVLDAHEQSRRAVAATLGVSPAAVTTWAQGSSFPRTEHFGALCATLGVAPAALAPDGELAARKNGRNGVTAWLEEHGLWGKDASAKEIPAAVFTLPKSQLALFLNRLFATDGWATTLQSGQPQLGYATISERLARQVQHLLLRFGVVASLRKRAVKYRDTRRVAWQLDVTDGSSIEKFCEAIGIFGKESAVASALDAVRGRVRRTNVDLIPIEIWERIRALKGSESWNSLAQRAGFAGHSNIHVGRRALSRSRLHGVAAALGDSGLASLAESDVYWDEIVAIEHVGSRQVYDLTIPKTHNFVANDVCVHNTSFALNVAQYAAKAGYTVGVFSLEMSSAQLVSRLLCSEAHIDAHRFRTGYLNRDEWARLADGLHHLSDAKIYIDDTPGITVMEMRAKARRLKQEHGLDMLLIDYLQLVQGRGRNENRTNEVSQISRDMKMLAKELNCPVIALSQLSRAPETRTDHRPQLSDLRESGCLAGDTLVTLADTGARVPIRDLVGRSGFRVWSLDEATMRTVPGTVSRAFATGTKPVFRLETKLGRVIRATANHKFRTFDGWRRLDELEIGERLAVPRRLPCVDDSTMTEVEAALLGHLIGDGCTLPRHTIQYTTRERELADLVAGYATSVFGDRIAPRVKAERSWYQVYLPASFRLTHGRRSPIAEWLDELGIFGLRSHEKRIPDAMFWQSESTLATSDVYWDSVVSIEPDGVEEVYDLTVDGYHNFEADAYYVHNSIEQDADLVAFIYREEMYGATDENSGVAELIIGKQRNGPTGTVRLAFLKEFTRFENLWSDGY